MNDTVSNDYVSCINTVDIFKIEDMTGDLFKYSS